MTYEEMKSHLTAQDWKRLYLNEWVAPYNATVMRSIHEAGNTLYVFAENHYLVHQFSRSLGRQYETVYINSIEKASGVCGIVFVLGPPSHGLDKRHALALGYLLAREHEGLLRCVEVDMCQL